MGRCLSGLSSAGRRPQKIWVSALDKHHRPGSLDSRHLFAGRRAWTPGIQPPAVGRAGSPCALLLGVQVAVCSRVLTWPFLCECLWPDRLFLEGQQPRGIKTPPQ